MATIFAWTGALRKRGELDGNKALTEFADKLEKATLSTIEAGKMTKDLAILIHGPKWVLLSLSDYILLFRLYILEKPQHTFLHFIDLATQLLFLYDYYYNNNNNLVAKSIKKTK